MRNKWILTKFVTLFISLCFFLFSVTAPVWAEENNDSKLSGDDILEYIEGIINWKKASLEIDLQAPLLNNTFLKNAGETSGDWFPIGMGRIGYSDDYQKYLAVVRDVIEERYKEENKLSDSKATEWHRISLAILSAGGDPTTAGEDESGKTINLIADGTYDRGKTASLGRQGLNGWIWGLITLDSMRYRIPEDAYDTRESMIVNILETQLDDGGFSLQSPDSDVDMTAMVIQALAPYYNSEETYTYKTESEKEVTKTVREVVDQALTVLSEMQLNNGDFGSIGTPNAESTAQVIVALTSLGIDPLEDERFIKDGNNVFHGVMNYLMEDGGFIHSESYDPDNPTSLPDESNDMASEQILYSLTALYRHYEGYRTLYDFREEMDEKEKERIESVQESIDGIPDNVSESDADMVKAIFKDYLDVPIEERAYVYNYKALADAMEELKIDNTSEPLAKNMDINKNGNGAFVPIFDGDKEDESNGKFTDDDQAVAEAISDQITTEHYVEVISLIDKLEGAPNKTDYDEILERLREQEKQIEVIEKEINQLNETIVDQLYPVSDIGIKDRKNVRQIIERYEALSPYDQQQVQSYDDVLRAETKINNSIRAGIISSVLVLVIGIVLFFYIRRLRKRKREKNEQNMMLDQDG